MFLDDVSVAYKDWDKHLIPMEDISSVRKQVDFKISRDSCHITLLKSGRD